MLVFRGVNVWKSQQRHPQKTLDSPILCSWKTKGTYRCLPRCQSQGFWRILLWILIPSPSISQDIHRQTIRQHQLTSHPTVINSPSCIILALQTPLLWSSLISLDTSRCDRDILSRSVWQLGVDESQLGKKLGATLGKPNSSFPPSPPKKALKSDLDFCWMAMFLYWHPSENL